MKQLFFILPQVRSFVKGYIGGIVMKRPGFLVLLGLVMAGLLLTAVTPASAGQTAQTGGQPITGYIALTFDDGPSGVITRRLLEGLAERQVRATFFLCGYRLEQYPEIAPLIAAGGHEIGLHGYSHDSMKEMSRATLIQELEQTAALIQEQTGIMPTLLRPPGGCCSETVRAVAEEQGLRIILWTVDPRDWACHDAKELTRRIVSETADGDIVLLHDMWNASVDGALAAIDRLRAQGYVFVTVSELGS